MLRIDWANPRITLEQFELFLAPYLGENYDGIRFENNYVYVCSKEQLSGEQEDHIMDYVFSLITTPREVITQSDKHDPRDADGTPLRKNIIDEKYLDISGAPYTNLGVVIFSSNFVNSDHPELFSSKVFNSGTVEYVPTESSMILSTTTENGSKAVYQTRRRMLYVSGSSLETKFTQVFHEPKVNVRQRVGCFFEDEGFFFETNDTCMGVVLRSKISGSIVETRWNRSEWLDPLDGTGPSGVNVDFKYGLILSIRYLWLGYGLVEFLAKTEKGVIVCHRYSGFNKLSMPYTKNSSFPIRAEIENIGTTESATSLRVGSFTTKSIGDTLVGSSLYSADTGDSGKYTIDTSMVPVISLRLGTNYISCDLQVEDVDILSTTDNIVFFEVVINSTLTGADWQFNSLFVEKDLSATASTGGRVIESGYIYNSSAHSIVNNVYNRLGSNIDGTPDTLTVRAKTISGSGILFCSVSYKEAG